VELDHVFVLTSRGAPEADALVAHGFVEGAPNVHPGQGTACRRFFFGNAYLALLWVADEAEAAGEAVQAARLLERWRRRGTGSPFGVALRPSSPEEPAPFRTWDYRPPWLADGAIPVAANSERLDEPFLFVLPFGRRPERPGTRREISRLVLESPVEAPSDEAIALAGHRDVEWRRAAVHGMILELDRAATGGTADLRPALPLQLRW
jgi:hypothetical protein